MTLVNTDYISGKELETLGLVKGSTIRAKHLGNDIVAGLKMIVGGELTEYGDMINEARAIATKRMVDEATALGADAVINVRYATSNVAKSAAEVLVYGTAIKYI
ncbi:MAG: YbjQ family protein [Spirochaetaceae bacterium]|nr:YbjQ family protein [Spirochaetaceae bacterium]MCF7939619.1 YbjQ family protein [Spirochaetales bacterium]